MHQNEHALTAQNKCLAPEIMRRVVFVGVSPASQGGVAAVLNIYKQNIEPFQMVESTCDGSKFIKILFLLTAFFKLLCFRIKGCKIAHIHGSSYNSFKRKRLLINYARHLGYKVIFHLHGAEFHQFVRQYGEKRIKKILDKCSKIIVLSPSWKSFFARTLQINDTCIVNNIIPKPILSSSPTEKNKLHLTFLGYIGDRKGVFDLLTVLANDKAFYRNKVLLTAGGNGESKRLIDFIEKNDLQDTVKYAGWISGAAKEQLLQSTDIYLLPSYNEGLPISVLEAMSFHIPVITTPVGGIKDLVKHERNGLLVTPGDHSELDKALKRMIADANLRKQIAENNAVDIQEFFPEKVFTQLQKIYVDLLRDEKSSTCGNQIKI